MFSTDSFFAALESSGLFIPADVYTARVTAGLAPEDVESIAVITALLSAAVRSGHVCLDLRSVETRQLMERFGVTKNIMSLLGNAIGLPESVTPIILDQGRLYFARMHRDEELLANKILALASTVNDAVDFTKMSALWSSVFGDKKGEDKPDWQQVACFCALRNRLCVISGGPGTGKTTTVGKILRLVSGLSYNREMKIRLAAPTGKAASRMSEAISSLATSDQETILPRKAETIHRLLGWRGQGCYIFNKENPIPLDLLIVDEVSMLDMEMAARLFEALPDHARVILLGDKNQLASVEAGALMANLCSGQRVNVFSAQFASEFKELTGNSLKLEKSAPVMADSVIELQTSYRFKAQSGIGALSTAIRSGNMKEVKKIINYSHPDLEIISGKTAKQSEVLETLIPASIRKLNHEMNPAAAFDILESFRVLSPLRMGQAGTLEVNARIKHLLCTDRYQTQEWYPGRPVLILENDYAANLYNGDIGITLIDETGKMRVFFKQADNNYFSVSIATLPRHETCYAMTVHKSQGSEFDHVIFLIPESDTALMTQELIYTALTRARKKCTLLGPTERFLEAVTKTTLRDSGLENRIWKVKKN